MRDESLVDYSVKLAGITRRKVRFVIIDGSTAEGSDRKHSDYDILVVRRGLSKPPGSVRNLFGVFDGRIVSGWLADSVSFRHRYLGDDDEQFLRRRRQLRKAKLLYGNGREFNKVIRKALARRWNRKRQMAVIGYSYVTMAEYMGKLLNKVEAREAGAPEFYHDGYIVATNAALLVAALNKIDLDSDRSMYRQILARARVKPPHFKRDFETVSGLSTSPRSSQAVISASRRLVRWVREEILNSFEPAQTDDGGFWRILQETRL
jgi:predicted nucleotidyltransferase